MGCKPGLAVKAAGSSHQRPGYPTPPISQSSLPSHEWVPVCVRDRIVDCQPHRGNRRLDPQLPRNTPRSASHIRPRLTHSSSGPNTTASAVIAMVVVGVKVFSPFVS
jgi:hypothetical protein